MVSTKRMRPLENLHWKISWVYFTEVGIAVYFWWEFSASNIDLKKDTGLKVWIIWFKLNVLEFL